MRETRRERKGERRGKRGREKHRQNDIDSQAHERQTDRERRERQRRETHTERQRERERGRRRDRGWFDKLSIIGVSFRPSEVAAMSFSLVSVLCVPYRILASHCHISPFMHSVPDLPKGDFLRPYQKDAGELVGIGRLSLVEVLHPVGI